MPAPIINLSHLKYHVCHTQWLGFLECSPNLSVLVLAPHCFHSILLQYAFHLVRQDHPPPPLVFFTIFLAIVRHSLFYLTIRKFYQFLPQPRTHPIPPPTTTTTTKHLIGVKTGMVLHLRIHFILSLFMQKHGSCLFVQIFFYVPQ